MPEHNRWAPNCDRFRKATGSYTQYLVDFNRNERCEACTDRENGSAEQ